MRTIKEPRRLNISESENPHVVETSFEAEDKSALPIEVEEREPVLSANGSSFHIDFYNRQDHYRGRIVLLGSGRKRILKGVDVASIADFISQNLPPLPRESAASSFFDEISLLQRGRVMGRGEPLRAWKYFSIHVRWNLPSAQVADAVDESNNIYVVQVWIFDEEQKHIVASNAEGGTFQPGFGSQGVSIDMGGLQPAKYFVKIQVILPFNRIKETTGIDIHVEP